MAKKKKDIFIEASLEAVKNALEPLKDKEKQNKSEQEALALRQTIEGDQWDELSLYVNKEGAARLISELKTMGGKDFVRNYLKVLEHFKPKLTRAEISPEDEVDKTINIELIQQLPSGETRTINLNNIKKKEEDNET